MALPSDSSRAKDYLIRRLSALTPVGIVANFLRKWGMPVFMFHRILPPSESSFSPELAISPQLFESFLQWLCESYRVVALDELVTAAARSKGPDKPLCSITFDDGWRDNFVNALPLLRKYQMPATVFLPVRFIGTRRRFWQERLWCCVQTLSRQEKLNAVLPQVGRIFPWCPPLSASDVTFSGLRQILLCRLTSEAEEFVNRVQEECGCLTEPSEPAFLGWDEVKKMQEADITFGSHTLNHVMLSRCDPETVRREVECSRMELEERLGSPVPGFSYPWGRTGRRLSEEVKNAGYSFALMGGEKLFDRSSDPWLIPRVFVSTSLLCGQTEDFQSGRTSLFLGSMALKSEDKIFSRAQKVRAPERLRIAFVIDAIDSWEDGGTEQQIRKLLLALDREYFEPQLYFLRPSAHLAPADFPCPLFLANGKAGAPWSRARTLWRLVQLFRRQQPHVVQTFFIDGSLYGVVAAWLAGVPHIIMSKRNVGYWKKNRDRASFGLLNRLANGWQCNSRSIWESLKQTEGVRGDRIEILPNAIDLERFSPPTPEQRIIARREIGLPPMAPVFVSVATLTPIKDPLTLVEAAGAVQNFLPDAHFIIVGEGSLRGAIQQRIKEVNLGSNFRLEGAQADVRRFLVAADIGLLTSRSEGCSNSILEYMAMGLPCVVSDLPANHELVDDVFFEPGNPPELADRILHLWNDSELRQRLGRDNHRRAMRFSPEAFSRQAQSYYRWLTTEVP